MTSAPSSALRSALQRAPVRLATFAAGLLVAFAAAYGVGGSFEPLLDIDERPAEHPATTETPHPAPTTH